MRATYLSAFESVPARHLLARAKAAQNLVELRMLCHEGNGASGRSAAPLDREALESRVRRFGAANLKIETRRTEILDYVLDLPTERARLTLFGDLAAPTIERRMAFYQERVDEVFGRLYPPASALPDHLIHVTCTGYVAPSAAQRIAAGSATQVTHAYHMGCYAALPAIRAGRGLVDPDRPTRVDLVHTEICTLHFDPDTVEPAQLVVQSLFADGHIKYSIAGESPAAGLRIGAVREQVLPDSRELMSWTVGGHQFVMNLSREVPRRIAQHLEGFVRELCVRAGVRPDARAIYAVHPGGPRVIDEVERTLGLGEGQTRESHAILARHGNMSSATLPHIWKEILDNPEREHGQVVVSLAFGPGLTLSGGVFHVCRA